MRPGVSTTSGSAVRSAATASATSLEVIMEQEQTIMLRLGSHLVPVAQRRSRRFPAQGIVGPQQSRGDATPGTPGFGNLVHLNKRRPLGKQERVLDRVLQRKVAG